MLRMIRSITFIRYLHDKTHTFRGSLSSHRTNFSCFTRCRHRFRFGAMSLSCISIGDLLGLLGKEIYFHSTVPRQYMASDVPHGYIDCTHSSDILISRDMLVYEDFISVEEEQSLLEEIETHMKRQRYECSHWDDAIHKYREVERKHWRAANAEILQRIKETAFTDQSTLLPYIHVLDIAKDGFIKPHIDANRFCGDTIAGLSLISTAVMRLTHDADLSRYADILLSRRSLYIMRDRVRYEFKHEVLSDENSHFKGKYVPRDRRVSIMLRNKPPDN